MYYVFTSVGLVGVRAVIGELLSTDHGAGVSTLHSPLSTRRLSPLHAGLLATCYGSSGEAVYLAEDGY